MVLSIFGFYRVVLHLTRLERLNI
ncbi:hypothetical protein NC651_007558 [Populus alba x Populus x berolinensis]|uniref:Uncharacterized protein n=1 Tax=Populus alba x Populus x berolinensis TaxID=444605 RepID=A0AAD6R699_9ROSI|nr:hypothetical protein NC651_007558 [Populus alba x Populus x berolinensis]KAJ7002457.1 hypothetical protein NC653_007818 [Populus alba x Populus x berolinensis]